MNREAEVVVTGIGAVTCHGAGAGTLWRAMTAAGVRLPDRPADPLARMELPLINLVPDLCPGAVPAAGRASRFASLAAAEALSDAGLDAASLSTLRTAVVLGSCMGEPGGNERGRGTDGGWAPPFRLATALAAELGLFATVHDLGNACAAGGYALGVAADLVRAGEADVVIAGGSDAYSRVALGCFNRLGAVDPERCRPFERDRAGTVFAEGAGILVVESAAHARARGALPAVRLDAVAWSCDADHPTAPGADGEQIVRAMREAVGGAPDTVGCVVPHGTGTRLNDVLESRALHRVLGPRAARVPLFSLKALLGHSGGASAALGAVAAALILRHGEIPPNVPLKEQDPECAVLLPQDGPVPPAAGAGRVLVNAYGFGGNNASLVLARTGGESR
ncbi:3-oxoacyl-[acyl-carrier-protein] synthase II [Streptomyces umbrinus]|uniref:3-oxoacyl-[acyl-carrier-protein] synthase II n=1 Tax=Streptomyces umbrinus TaxID=67370 RepID=A0ABU0STU5_9ACTN|nr:beta-ketoacyl synthase N-terminal-like domain-containing protein [Streptomyces umbrinus]MDQ1026958.1 3-oxoacyl-[acyl-carrier-protein] synthase II [Streptomyces umbrinus]